jgi:hypothetical protein
MDSRPRPPPAGKYASANVRTWPGGKDERWSKIKKYDSWLFMVHVDMIFWISGIDVRDLWIQRFFTTFLSD